MQGFLSDILIRIDTFQNTHRKQWAVNYLPLERPLNNTSKSLLNSCIVCWQTRGDRQKIRDFCFASFLFLICKSKLNKWCSDFGPFFIKSSRCSRSWKVCVFAIVIFFQNLCGCFVQGEFLFWLLACLANCACQCWSVFRCSSPGYAFVLSAFNVVGFMTFFFWFCFVFTKYAHVFLLLLWFIPMCWLYYAFAICVNTLKSVDSIKQLFVVCVLFNELNMRWTGNVN